jgi:Fe-S-cluster containining protein
VQIVDAALANAALRARRSDGGSWLACRVGCTSCCHGVFRISALDAERLRTALRGLEQEDRSRSEAIQTRAQNLVNNLRPAFPGDPCTGTLDPEEGSTWDAFADLPEADEPCPVLDPVTGRCELYAGRPLTCRIFGPPVENEAGIGICELCYVGASKAEVLEGEMYLEHHALEEELNHELSSGETTIAWALLPDRK